MSNQNSNGKPTLPAIRATSDDPYAELAAESGSQFGKIFKHVKGEYACGTATIPLGSRFVVNVPEAMRGDVRFEGGKPVEQRIGKIADRYKFAKREDLGFTDETLWEKTPSGDPRDPWSQQTYLPMTSETGELFCFVTGAFGGRKEIANLCGQFSPWRDSGLLPIIEIGTRRYRHAAYGLIDEPTFRIVGWHGKPEAPQQPQVLTPDKGGGTTARIVGESKAAPQGEGDVIEADEAIRIDREMNDDIPF